MLIELLSRQYQGGVLHLRVDKEWEISSFGLYGVYSGNSLKNPVVHFHIFLSAYLFDILTRTALPIEAACVHCQHVQRNMNHITWCHNGIANGLENLHWMDLFTVLASHFHFLVQLRIARIWVDLFVLKLCIPVQKYMPQNIFILILSVPHT